MVNPPLVVLRSGPRLPQVKQYTLAADGILRRSKPAVAKHWTLELVEIGSFSALASLLDRLETDPHAVVIRGVPVDKTAVRVRRTSKGADRTFLGAPRRELGIDIDDLRIDGVDALRDSEGAVEAVIRLLPAQFHGAACRWSFSASAGMHKKPDGSYEVAENAPVSLHLWFWLDRPVSDEALRAWAKAFNVASGYKIVDPAFFHAVQEHFIAAPLFPKGFSGPLPRRSGVIEGVETVAVGDGEHPILVTPGPTRERLIGAKPLGEGGQAAASGVVKALKAPRVGKKDKPVSLRPACTGRGVEAFLDQIGALGLRGPIVGAIAAAVGEGGITSVDCAEAEALKAIIRALAEGRDLGGRSASYVARVLSDADLNALIRWTIDQERAKPAISDKRDPLRKAIRGIKTVAAPAAAVVPAKPVSADEAKGLIRTNIRKAFGELVESTRRAGGERPKLIVDTTTAGGGKSKMAAEVAVETVVETGLRIGYLAPEISTLGDRWDEVAACDPDVSTLVWKSAGKHGCPFTAERHALYSLGQDANILCASGEDKCIHHATCAFVAARAAAGTPQIVFAANNFVDATLPLPSPLQGLDIIVIDEQIKDKICPTRSMPADLLESPRTGEPKDRRVALDTVLEAARRRVNAAELLIERKQTLDLVNALMFVEALLRRPVFTARPNLTAGDSRSLDAEVKRGLRDERDLLVFLKHQVEAVRAGAPAGIVYMAKRPEGRKVEWVERRAIHFDDKPILMLDGDADLDVLKALFPGHDIVEQGERPAMKARIVQIMDSVMATSTLLSEEKGQQLIGEVHALIERLARRHRKLLVVVPLSYEIRLQSGDWTPPPNVSLAHFGALRSKNDWKDHDAALVLGRPQPSVDQTFAQAQAIFQGERLERDAGETFALAPAAHDLKDGTAVIGKVPYPADKRVRVVLSLIREAELRQALHRLRLIYREEMATVYVATSIPLGMPIDEICSLDDLLGRDTASDLGKTVERLGFLPVSPKVLAAVASDLFPKPHNAKDRLVAAGLRVLDVQEGRLPESLTDFGVVKVRVREAGEVLVLVRPSVDAKTALRDALGKVGLTVVSVQPLRNPTAEGAPAKAAKAPKTPKARAALRVETEPALDAEQEIVAAEMPVVSGVEPRVKVRGAKSATAPKPRRVPRRAPPAPAANDAPAEDVQPLAIAVA